MKVIVYHNPDTNRAAIIIPAWNDQTRPAGETDAECLTRVIAKTIGADTPHTIMDDSQLPQSREHRDRWTYDHRSGTIRTGG
jgi:hypothetical protein